MRLAIVTQDELARDQHVLAIAMIPQIELIAIVSPNGTIDGIPWLPSFDSLLGSDTDVDAVAICTPPHTRVHDAALALDSGRHVLLDAPPTATVAEMTALFAMAEQAGLTLFATWHARYTQSVAHARRLVATNGATSIRISWLGEPHKQPADRHHDQAWRPGGLGVLDVGIGALSILTEIVPETLTITAADLSIPSNRDVPVAATLHLSTPSGLTVTALFDHRQKHDRHWNIDVHSAAGTFALSNAGRLLTMGGRLVADGPVHAYQDIYRRFLDLVRSGASDIDTTPLAHVAEAFAIGRRTTTAPMED